MKKFLKFLGAAALIAGFTPYQISGDKETGSVKVKALLWQLTSKPGVGEDKRNIDINFGLASASAMEEEVESDLFSDELTVNYNGAVEDAAEPVEEVEEPAESKTLEVPEEPEAAEEPDELVEPEASEEE